MSWKFSPLATVQVPCHPTDWAGEAQTFVNEFDISCFFKKHQNDHRGKYQNLANILPILSPLLGHYSVKSLPLCSCSCLWDAPPPLPPGAAGL